MIRRLMSAKYSGTCVACDQRFPVGTMIYWNPFEFVKSSGRTGICVHEDCKNPRIVERPARAPLTDEQREHRNLRARQKTRAGQAELELEANEILARYGSGK